ncbi:MAG: hypothetical protein V8S27_01635 [Lachnospiraceae bacterium]
MVAEATAPRREECARAHSFLYMGRNFLDIVMVADFVDLLEKKHRLTLFPETFIIFLRKYADGRNRSGESEDFSDRYEKNTGRKITRR